MVESKREAWHEIVQAGGRRGRGRAGTEFRLPARHERTRHGQRRRPGSRILLDDHRVGEGSGAHAGAGEADAQYHRHPPRGARREARRRGRAVRHQHDQLDHRHRSGYVGSAAQCRRRIGAWRLLRTRRETDRAAHGPADRGRSGSGAAHFGHRRRFRLARCGGIYSAGLRRACSSAPRRCIGDFASSKT